MSLLTACTHFLQVKVPNTVFITEKSRIVKNVGTVDIFDVRGLMFFLSVSGYAFNGYSGILCVSVNGCSGLLCVSGILCVPLMLLTFNYVIFYCPRKISYQVLYIEESLLFEPALIQVISISLDWLLWNPYKLLSFFHRGSNNWESIV